jgi:lysophospholipase L1-like esterase
MPENRNRTATMGTDTEVQNAESKPETGRSEKVHSSSRKKTPKSRRVVLAFLGGGILAVVLMEAILHNFSGKSEDAAGFEERDYREGFAKAHFSADGLRLTGNPQIAGAPSVLIIGDSHVEAYSVYDEQTMGSILERKLRVEGKSWNVLQYGWRGADGPDYVYQAKLVVDKFHPNWIFLFTTKGDFASTSTGYARLVDRDGKVTAEPAEPGIQPGRPPSYGGALTKKVKESGLLYAAVVRLRLEVLPNLLSARAEQKPEPVQQPTVETVNEIVRGLKQGYGNKLLVLYAPDQPYSASAPAEPQETALLAACKEYGLACRSLHDPMIQDLLVRHVLDRGEANTAPGWGHFNARGHELAADEIDRWLKELP